VSGLETYTTIRPGSYWENRAGRGVVEVVEVVVRLRLKASDDAATVRYRYTERPGEYVLDHDAFRNAFTWKAAS
jgi:hypothetical protein